MKQSKRLSLMAPLFLVLGTVAAALYRWLFTQVEDTISWLLPAFTLPELLLWALTAAAAVTAFLCTRKTVLRPMGRIFPAVSSVLLGGGVATLLLEEVKGPEVLVQVYHGLCLLSAAALVAAAFFRGTGHPVPFLLELPVCLLLVLQLLICYQLWSEVPQLMDYFPGLGAVLCLTLAGFFRLTWVSGLPGKAWHNAIGLLGIYFCVMAVAQGRFGWFFTAAAIWLAGLYAGISPAEG